jgi:uncharacterized protein
MLPKWLYYFRLAMAVLAGVLFAAVYQEYGPIDEKKLTIQRIREKNIVADFFYPTKESHLPLVVALGGSAGGFLPDKELQSLALEGYAVLSLAYFNVGPLPKNLVNIPLEYFDNAIAWASSQNAVDTTKVLILGVSRGAELALLLASHYSYVKAVVAYAPGCFILPGTIDYRDTTVHSSWSWQGRPLSFAPVSMLESNQHTIHFRRLIEPFLSRSDNELYTIPTERAKSAILLLSGTDDQVWPASEMATLIDERLKRKRYPHSIRNVIFPEAGHSLFQLQDNYQLLSSVLFRVFTIDVNGKSYHFEPGGSAWTDMLTKRKAREETLQFLQQFK